MAVYKRTYKAYSGPFTPAWSRFTVLTRYGLSTLFDSRPFTAYTVLCFLPFLVGLAYIYVVHNAAAQALLRMGNAMPGTVNNDFFLGFLGFEAGMGFILAAWGGPGMITKDFANHSVQLYLSRPISRTEYLVGKVSVLAALLSCITWFPALILFFVKAELQGHGWLWENLWMAVAVWVKWRIAATALMLGIFFLLPAAAQILDAILRTQWGNVFNITHMISLVWMRLFRESQAELPPALRGIPLWAAWVSLLSTCAACFWLLDRKLRAREVERS
jgi:ABC-2 type transport system permease protein